MSHTTGDPGFKDNGAGQCWHCGKTAMASESEIIRHRALEAADFIVRQDVGSRGATEAIARRLVRSYGFA